MAEPALGRGYQAARNPRSLPAGKLADDDIGPLTPGQAQSFRRHFFRRGKIETGRQKPAFANFAGPLKLRNGEIVGRRPRPTLRVHKSHGTVRGAKVDAYEVFGLSHSLIPRPSSARSARVSNALVHLVRGNVTRGCPLP